MKKQILYGFTFLLVISSCTSHVPDGAVTSEQRVTIQPDYNELTIPPNIAPLCFSIAADADEYVTRIYSRRGEEIVITGKQINPSVNDWHRLLESAKGDTLRMDVYLRRQGEWTRHPSLWNEVATEPIDSYISYRLIEPSYVGYEVMTINQRNLTNFDEREIYNNFLLSDGDNGQCVNCHSYQDYNRTGKMQMHTRQNMGGTVIVSDGKAEKVNLKTEKTISGGVYPSWHPKFDLIAYSVNSTGQIFHTKNLQKVEVLDYASDLILYDVARHEVHIIANETDEYETFPYWSSDGKWLYYASAHYRQQTGDIDQELSENYQQLKYNLYRKPFDAATLSFGAADTVFYAAGVEKSATFPRESPDGRYLLFTLGDYGNFHIWHKSADLYLKDLFTGRVRALKEVNSSDVESYHSWSSNGRWIIFSSRRDDGSYTRPYITYFDKNGQARKPFVLPQSNPDFYLDFFKSYNIPEFMVAPVTIGRNTLVNSIRNEAKGVTLVARDSVPVLRKIEMENENIYE